LGTESHRGPLVDVINAKDLRNDISDPESEFSVCTVAICIRRSYVRKYAICIGQR
jgi:hypothetical protein